MKINSSLAHLTKTGGGVVVDDDVRRYDPVFLIFLITPPPHTHTHPFFGTLLSTEFSISMY